MLIPLYGFLRHDTVGLLVLVQDDDTIATVAERLQQAASVRVAPRGNLAVYHNAKRLDPRLTVIAAGLTALERVDVRAEDG
jgi:hypothetical protein